MSEPIDYPIPRPAVGPTSAWTCGCGQKGDGFAEWLAHRDAEASPKCRYGDHTDHVHIDFRSATDLGDLLGDRRYGCGGET